MIYYQIIVTFEGRAGQCWWQLTTSNNTIGGSCSSPGCGRDAIYAHEVQAEIIRHTDEHRVIDVHRHQLCDQCTRLYDRLLDGMFVRWERTYDTFTKETRYEHG